MVFRRCAATVLATSVLAGCVGSRPTTPSAATPDGWPVPQRMATMTSGFGAPRGEVRHQGIDLSAPQGTAVRATAPGRVDIAHRMGGWGRVVLLDHGDGWQTRYAHLKRIKVKEGDRVDRGSVIGTVGKTGNASGFHLHYEVIKDGTPIDPRPYLSD
jgi:murein DD-endopeptidase MepM/ murein hydrolase activator NlpD